MRIVEVHPSHEIYNHQYVGRKNPDDKILARGYVDKLTFSETVLHACFTVFTIVGVCTILFTIIVLLGWTPDKDMRLLAGIIAFVLSIIGVAHRFNNKWFFVVEYFREDTGQVIHSCSHGFESYALLAGLSLNHRLTYLSDESPTPRHRKYVP